MSRILAAAGCEFDNLEARDSATSPGMEITAQVTNPVGSAITVIARRDGDIDPFTGTVTTGGFTIPVDEVSVATVRRAIGILATVPMVQNSVTHATQDNAMVVGPDQAIFNGDLLRLPDLLVTFNAAGQVTQAQVNAARKFLPRPGAKGLIEIDQSRVQAGFDRAGITLLLARVHALLNPA